MNDALTAVRELHAPQVDTGGGACNDLDGPDCHGCYWDDECGYASWPCATASLVYSTEEIAKEIQAAELVFAPLRIKRQEEREARRNPTFTTISKFCEDCHLEIWTPYSPVMGVTKDQYMSRILDMHRASAHA